MPSRFQREGGCGGCLGHLPSPCPLPSGEGRLGSAIERISIGLALAGGVLLVALGALVTVSVLLRWWTTQPVPLKAAAINKMEGLLPVVVMINTDGSPDQILRASSCLPAAHSTSPRCAAISASGRSE